MRFRLNKCKGCNIVFEKNKKRNSSWSATGGLPEREGFFITEIVVSLTVLGILIAVLTISLHGLAKFNLFQLVRQRGIAAAQAQLDSIAITGQPISDEDFKRLWPKLDVVIEESKGTGQWQGMKLPDESLLGIPR